MNRFAAELRRIRGFYGITLGQIEKQTRMSSSFLDAVESGDRIASPNLAIKIIDALPLVSSKEKEQLLTVYNEDVHERLTTKLSYFDDQLSIPMKDREIVGEITFNNTLPSEIGNGIDDLVSRFERLTDMVSELGKTPNETSDYDLKKELQGLKHSIGQALKDNVAYSAPVFLPSRDQMEVRLVPATSLHQLEEYRSDQNQQYAMASIFLGFIGGMAINWASQENVRINLQSVILFLVFLIMCVFFIWHGRVIQKRGDKLKQRLLTPGELLVENEDISPSIDD